MTTDREQIVELMTFYGRALDTREPALLRRAFTDDAVIDYGNFGGALRGLAALDAYMDEALTPLDATQHLFGSFSVEVDGDTGQFHCLVQAQHVREDADGGHLYTVGGHYVNEVCRTAHGWRMTRLTFIPTWRGGNPAVLAHVEDASAPT